MYLMIVRKLSPNSLARPLIFSGAGSSSMIVTGWSSRHSSRVEEHADGHILSAAGNNRTFENDLKQQEHAPQVDLIVTKRGIEFGDDPSSRSSKNREDNGGQARQLRFLRCSGGRKRALSAQAHSTRLRRVRRRCADGLDQRSLKKRTDIGQRQAGMRARVESSVRYFPLLNQTTNARFSYWLSKK